MPHKARLLQAIREADAKLLQHQAFHILGPGAVILIFIVLAGEVAVRLVKAPELFGGGLVDVMGYGAIAIAIILWVSKGYAYDKWMEGWLHMRGTHEYQVKKITAVIERLERAERGEAEPEPVFNPGSLPPPSDAWQAALRHSKPTEKTEAEP